MKFIRKVIELKTIFGLIKICHKVKSYALVVMAYKIYSFCSLEMIGELFVIIRNKTYNLDKGRYDKVQIENDQMVFVIILLFVLIYMDYFIILK